MAFFIPLVPGFFGPSFVAHFIYLRTDEHAVSYRGRQASFTHQRCKEVAKGIRGSAARNKLNIYRDVPVSICIELNQAIRPRDTVNEDEDTTGGKRGNLTRNVGRSLAD